jgi:hypothetical protein
MGERPRRLVALLVRTALGTGVARAVSLKASFDPHLPWSLDLAHHDHLHSGGV